MLSETAYPHLVEFMEKCLYQSAAPTFRDAILAWKQCGEASVRDVLTELNGLLSESASEPFFTQFVDKHCDYTYGNSARTTLEYIKGVLMS